MQLCFDATRFGFGLQEAIDLASAKGISAIEYTFEPFDVRDKGSTVLSSQESDYLKSVCKRAAELNVQISCIKLNYLLKVSDKASLKEFKAMLKKLAKLASLLACPRIIFYLQPETENNWKELVESSLRPILKDMEKAGLRLLLSLSTPACYRGHSLKSWRSLDPQELRELLALMPELSLSYSAADLAWQSIDYLRILSGLAKAIEHVEAQDVEINRDMLADSGLFGPLWWRYKVIGKGQIDWRQLVEALKLYEFNGSLSIQLDDEFIGADYDQLSEALDSSIKLLAPLVKY